MIDVMPRNFFPNPTPVSERLARCRVLLSEDKNTEALSVIREIIKDNPQHIGALIFFSKMCRKYCDLNGSDEELNNLNELLELRPFLKNTLLQKIRYFRYHYNNLELVLNDFETLLSLRTDHVETLNKQTIPSLQSMCKWSFFKHESSICAKGNVFRYNPDKLRNILSNSDITPITLATMRKKFNGNEDISAKTVFDQLDSMDIERVFGRSGIAL